VSIAAVEYNAYRTSAMNTFITMIHTERTNLFYSRDNDGDAESAVARREKERKNIFGGEKY